MRGLALGLVAGLLLGAACSDGGGAVDPGDVVGDTSAQETAGDTTDTTPRDLVAPTLRDVRVTLTVHSEVALDLNVLDATRVIPAPGAARFTVFARDETSAADALVLTVVDDDNATVTPNAPPSLDNGLWSVSVVVAPGDTLRVRVADAAGNVATSDHALILPAHDDAIIGRYSRRDYDDNQTVTRGWGVRFAEASAYTEAHPEAPRAGTWALRGDRLVVDVSVIQTGERWRRDAPYYLDGVYLADGVYRRDGDGGGDAGTWRATTAITAIDADGADGPVTTAAVTLLLNADGTFIETTTTDVDGASATRERGGAWEVELADNYAESFGDFLRLTPTDEAPTLHLFARLGDAMLLDPLVRRGE